MPFDVDLEMLENLNLVVDGLVVKLVQTITYVEQGRNAEKIVYDEVRIKTEKTNRF